MTPIEVHRLAGVHPTLKAAVVRILEAMALLGHPMTVTDGVRTDEEQFLLWRQGRDLPGPDVSPTRPMGRTVTNASGKPGSRSNHQLHADGTGHAVDCAFLVNGQPSWAEAHPWRLYGEVAKALGLAWGGDWPKPKTDRPHVEMKS